MSAFTLAHLEALEKAIAEGVLEISYSDKTVKYRSLDEMLRIRDVMRKELGITTGTARRLYMSTCKGTDTDGASDE